MNSINTLLIVIGLSLDSFVVMMNQASRLAEVKVKDNLKYSLIYATINLGALLIGYALSAIAKGVMTDRLEIIIGFIFILNIGFYILMKSIKNQPVEEKCERDFDEKKCLTLAAFTSIDTFVLGICLSFLSINLLTASVFMFTVTFAAVLIAIWVGYTQGAHFTRALGITGGTVLIIFSLFLLAKYIAR